MAILQTVFNRVMLPTCRPSVNKWVWSYSSGSPSNRLAECEQRAVMRVCVCACVGTIGPVLEVPDVIYSLDIVQFNCSEMGGATYRWRRDSQLLPGGSDGSLVISVTLEWAGSCLTCEVVETGGNASQRLQVVCEWLPWFQQCWVLHVLC